MMTLMLTEKIRLGRFYFFVIVNKYPKMCFCSSECCIYVMYSEELNIFKKG